jgi:hypothetical protein
MLLTCWRCFQKGHDIFRFNAVSKSLDPFLRAVGVLMADGSIVTEGRNFSIWADESTELLLDHNTVWVSWRWPVVSWLSAGPGACGAR